MPSFEKVRVAAEALRSVMPDLHKWFEASGPNGKAGLRLLGLGNFAAAEECFLRAVAELDQRPATRRRHARLLLALSTTQWKLKKLPEARKNAEEVRDLLTGAKLKQAAE